MRSKDDTICAGGTGSVLAAEGKIRKERCKMGCKQSRWW
jgi:hypothetical protein